ncbi:osmoprotectant NAGGN system M42 family peptidase [Solimonas marina]|uniref:Osmoprotectant NAGGN system M42 family peptidase n=1 Tax=Solimonas marina TaxID=2714601 RepID=A0A970B4X6_9GAMM|nr:osmoprotectant NAGGN system M42 family peptidase [Solimonas marina]NKF21098.1 osmoprotectant NAGGN system M42 family peptidase [Solimonas marina]
MRKLNIDQEYLKKTLLELLAIPSPVGLTDEVVHYTCGRLDALGVPYELTRRGAIRATIRGETDRPACAVVAHLDTLGATVRQLKPNGRLMMLPLGTWSARFAEGARVTVFTDKGAYRGTILPLKASGHAFNDAVDTQPSGWEYIELRLDEQSERPADLRRLGVNIGDFIAIDPQPEILANGYISSRHLDDKAGVAALLAAIKALVESDITLPVHFHPMFTVTEEVGFGASAILNERISEMVGIDIAIPAEGQNSREHGVTIAICDSSGPFDYHLTRELIAVCQLFGIPHQRDVFPYYFSDSAAALRAGFDIRHALIGFGADSSHGYERTHISALVAIAELLALYAQNGPVIARDRRALGPLEGFPHQWKPEDIEPIEPLPMLSEILRGEEEP